MQLATSAPIATTDESRKYVYAWLVATVFYFLEYLVRSAPAVMVPELSHAFNVSTLAVSGLIGSYYYTYAITSLIAGVLLDQFGAKYIVAAGMTILGLGCILFAVPQIELGYVGRLMQGAGSAFAFTGAVYLASNGLPVKRLATAVGVTQCVGMLGGSAGQLAVGPTIHGMLTVASFWPALGVVVIVISLGLFLVTPKSQNPAKAFQASQLLSTYKVVFSNPQSYLCGAVAGLMFAPTTILDMVWGVRFLEVDNSFTFQNAVFASSMVPLGWVIGCPLFGYLADALPRRKIALMIGAVLMLVCFMQRTFLPGALPVWLTLLVFGIGSGAAMVPYTIIKEVNPDNVKGSSTGAINFMNFGVASLLAPFFATRYGKSLGSGVDPEMHLFHAHIFWIAIIVIAIALALIIRERSRSTPKLVSANAA